MGTLREEIERQLRLAQEAKDKARRDREEDQERRRLAELDRQEGLQQQAMRAAQLLEEIGARHLLQEFNGEAWRGRGSIREWISENKGSAGITLYLEVPDVTWVVDRSSESHYEGSGEGVYLVYTQSEKGHYETYMKSVEVEMVASQTHLSIHKKNAHAENDSNPSSFTSFPIEPGHQLRSQIVGYLAREAISWSKPTPVERQPLLDVIVARSRDRVRKYAGKKKRHI